jgi:hypothetical protein
VQTLKALDDIQSGGRCIFGMHKAHRDVEAIKPCC